MVRIHYTTEISNLVPLATILSWQRIFSRVGNKLFDYWLVAGNGFLVTKDYLRDFLKRLLYGYNCQTS